MADDSLMREVNDDLRRERMQRLWQRYRAPLLAIVAALVMGTAGSSLWRDYQSKKAGEAFMALDAAVLQLQQGDAEAASKKFAALVKKSSGELRDIALLWQGRAAQQSGDAKAASAAWTALAAQPQAGDLVWRDLACLNLQSGGGDVPASCAALGDSPLKVQRLEWSAAQLWHDGKTEQAQALLQAVIDDATTDKTQRARAQRLLRALAAKAA